MDKKEILELIIYKFFNGSATYEESRVFIDWLNQSRENRLHYFSLKRIWIENKDISDRNRLTEDSLNRLKLRISLKTSGENEISTLPKTRIKKFSVAAIILILIGFTSFFGVKLKSLSDFGKTDYEITAPYGARINIVLNDGTIVWLNSGSTIIYRSDFGRGNRNVFLTGEAFFDVRMDKRHVFTVNTRDMDIRALGTKFNIKSYPEEDITEATLISGIIEVKVTDEVAITRPVLLSSNQKLTYNRGSDHKLTAIDEGITDEEIIVLDETEQPSKPSLKVLNLTDTDIYTCWKNGRLTFRSETLEKLATKLERFYNVNIIFIDDSIKYLVYTGTLEEVTIEEVMRAIASTSDINFNIAKKNIYLSRSKPEY